jgi:hypothetical protein
MERVRISYFDQNTEIEPQLPVDAEVLGKATLDGSPHEWWLIGLEQPLRHEGIAYPCALIASRWAGYPLSGPEPTSAFLLLSPSRTLESGASVSGFPFVAWCMVELCGA